ncbi:sigma-70 family RNA polymerase sigma factor [Sphingomonas sp. R86521]|uniref:sigma-70 family RNA polymerase sigma factor n=1 Tax=Sphingomonas sp. R86521 TaxID=3093860 RepID=UPI0036D2BA4A
MTPSSSTADTARAYLADMLLRTGTEDRAAFDELYRLTNAKLFGITLRICGERQAAEDVLHDVYITIWRRASGWEPGRASPITWLATIARNRAIDWRRAQGVRRTSPIDDVPDIADPGEGAERMMLANEDAQRLLDCLDGLDGQQRDAIRTAFFDGVTYAELAIARAVPLGTMKSWVRRGLARLKDCLRG